MLRSLARTAYWGIKNTWYSRGRFKGSRLEPSVQWRGCGSIRIDTGVYIGSATVISTLPGSTLDIGSGVWIGKDCELSAGGHIHIGEHTSLQNRTQLHGDVTLGAGCVGAANLYISSGRHEFRAAPPVPILLQDARRAQTAWNERSRPVLVGDDCWLGINVVVTPGVTIGRGCIVGANAVVTSDLPPYSIAAGAPARVIGQRLDFAPPRKLEAASDIDAPYFYSGFRQLGTTPLTGELRRIRGGWSVKPDFVIAIAALPGDVIELHTHSIASGRLVHGSGGQSLERGFQRVRVAAQPDSEGFSHFKWLPETPCEPDSLVILEVRADANGIGRAVQR